MATKTFLEGIVKISKANYDILMAGGTVQGYKYNPKTIYMVQYDDDTVVYTDKNQEISGSKIFTGNTVIYDLTVNDGIVVSDENQQSDKKYFATDGSIQEIPDATLLTEITYASLKAKRDAGELVPGMQYRIIDYECTTKAANTRSAGNKFDIIVVAQDKSTLQEHAHAIAREGDTYFATSRLSAWELKYSLDNDTTRYGWADATNGKGVIYWMKDEYCNEAAYDFKNIQYKLFKVTAATPKSGFGTETPKSILEKFVGHYAIKSTLYGNQLTTTYSTTDTKYFYTFSHCQGGIVGDDGTVVDGSIKSSFVADDLFSNNVIKEYIPQDKANSQIQLNWIVFKPAYAGAKDDVKNNVFGSNCNNIVMPSCNCVWNHFLGNHETQSLYIGGTFNYNTIDDLGYSLITNNFSRNAIIGKTYFVVNPLSVTNSLFQGINYGIYLRSCGLTKSSFQNCSNLMLDSEEDAAEAPYNHFKDINYSSYKIITPDVTSTASVEWKPNNSETILI